MEQAGSSSALPVNSAFEKEIRTIPTVYLAEGMTIPKELAKMTFVRVKDVPALVVSWRKRAYRHHESIVVQLKRNALYLPELAETPAENLINDLEDGELFRQIADFLDRLKRC